MIINFIHTWGNFNRPIKVTPNVIKVTPSVIEVTPYLVSQHIFKTFEKPPKSIKVTPFHNSFFVFSQ